MRKKYDVDDDESWPIQRIEPANLGLGSVKRDSNYWVSGFRLSSGVLVLSCASRYKRKKLVKLKSYVLLLLEIRVIIKVLSNP